MTPRSLRALLWACALGLLTSTACEPPPDDRVLGVSGASNLAPYASLSLPPVQRDIPHRVGAVWGRDGEPLLELIGYDIEAEEASWQEPLKITWYWRALGSTDAPLKVMVHLRSATGFENADHHPQSGRRPISTWKTGELIVDTQTLRLPATASEDGEGVTRVSVGVFDEKSGPRLPLIALDAPLSVSEEAVTVARVKTYNGLSLVAPRADRAPRLDGKLDEADWARAIPSAPFSHPVSGGQVGDTRVRAIWAADALYVGFEVKDGDIHSTRTERDSRIWEQDCVEIYLDPDDDLATYWELQIGAGEGPDPGLAPLFDAYFVRPRYPDWEIASDETLTGLTAAIHRDGTLNDDNPDRGYTVEVRIPFAGITAYDARSGIQAPIPPRPGDRWRVNFFHVDHNQDASGKTSTRHGSWSRSGGDFHNLAGFSELIFAAP